MKPKVFVLGGGFAGLSAVNTLSSLAARGRIDVTLIDRQLNSTFLPLLPDLISGKLRPAQMQHPLEHHCRRRSVRFLQATVLSIEPGTRAIQTDAGSFVADSLICCLGCENNYYGDEVMRRKALGLKTVGDGLEIRARAMNWVSSAAKAGRTANFLVAGGGYTGFEMASHLALLISLYTGRPVSKLAPLARVIVVEKARQVLGNVAPLIRRYGIQLLDRYGVELHTNVYIRHIDGDRATLSNGMVIDPAMIFWAAGVRPGTAVANLPPRPGGRRLWVDEHLAVHDQEGIFAAGDVAGFVSPGQQDALRMSVQFSLMSGRTAARNVLRRLAGRRMVRYRPVDLGYVVPLGPGQGAGKILGVSLSGRTPLVLHYLMCAYRSWSWKNRFGIFEDLLLERSHLWMSQRKAAAAFFRGSLATRPAGR